MRTALFLSFAIPALAQFSGLSTTTDGSQLYFSSPMQLTGSTDTSSDPKIFRYDGTHFSLYAHLAKVLLPVPKPLAGQYSIYSNYYSLQSPYVSGSGAITGYVGYADCVECPYDHILPTQTTFQFSGALGTLVLPYACDASTNGRYALCLTDFPASQERRAMFIDLLSLQQTPTITSCVGDSQYMTASGSVLIALANSYTLWSPATGSTAVSLPSAFSSYPCPMISNDGSLIAYQSTAGLAIYDVATQTATPLVANQIANGSEYRAELVTISDDARFILAETYDGSQWHFTIVDSSNGSKKDLASLQPGAGQTATLSGDGTIAYVVATDGTLLKIDTQSGVNQSLLGNQPLVVSYDPLVAGSFNRIRGSGFSTSPQVLINGAPIPVISSTATEIDVQIPWETPAGTATLQVTAPTAIFQQVIRLPMQAIAPTLLGQPIHQDFRGFVTEASPAQAGEIVQFYFTGLGPVTPQVAD